MHQDAPRLRILALLLALIFLGAQFHFCADLTSATDSDHFCPICSVASSALVAHSLSIAPLPVANRLERSGLRLVISAHIPRSISPRAPPSLAINS
jgi:hypothetical protein